MFQFVQTDHIAAGLSKLRHKTPTTIGHRNRCFNAALGKSCGYGENIVAHQSLDRRSGSPQIADRFEQVLLCRRIPRRQPRRCVSRRWVASLRMNMERPASPAVSLNSAVVNTRRYDD